MANTTGLTCPDAFTAVTALVRATLRTTTTKLFVGIDPGVTGALAFVVHDGGLTAPLLLDLPTTVVRGTSTRKGKTVKASRSVYDVWTLASWLRPLGELASARRVVFGLERGQPMPTDTAKTAHSVGVSYGLWPLYFASCGFAWREFSPVQWKTRTGLLGQDKEAVRLHACRTYPQAAPFLARKKDHNRAEALLIAAYTRDAELTEQ